VPKPEIIDVREELIANTEDLVIQPGRERALPAWQAIRIAIPRQSSRHGGLRLPS
jgi:hypothetical protein